MCKRRDLYVSYLLAKSGIISPFILLSLRNQLTFLPVRQALSYCNTISYYLSIEVCNSTLSPSVLSFIQKIF